jgi:RNA polymerase sigma factor for flagellar operon FliA
MKTSDALQAMWREYKRTSSVSLRNQIIEQYLPLVDYLSERMAERLPRCVDVDEVRSAGVLGLMDAVEGFDLGRGIKFETYCSLRVRGSILDELRSRDWVPRLVRSRAALYEGAADRLRRQLGREPAAHEMAGTLDVPVEEVERLRRESHLTTVYNLAPQEDREDDPRMLRRLDVLMDRESDVPFDRLVAEDLARALVNVLDGPERTVIALYYYEGLTMKEIGRVMEISESRVCQIHTKTLRRLKARLDQVGARARRAAAR